MDILGLSFSPDSAAALVRDGAVVAAVTDERLTRRKHSRDFPAGSVRFCLEAGGTELAAVDRVAFFWNPGVHLESFNVRRSAAWRHHSEYLAAVPNHLLALRGGTWPGAGVDHVEQTFALSGQRPLRVAYVTHHLAHAASAFFVSPFEEAAVLTVDGYGERTSTLLAQGRGNRLTTLSEVEFPDSLGAFYAAVTQYLGFLANSEEGTVMGLAAHGEPRFLPALRETVRLLPGGGFEMDLSWYAWHQERPRRYSRKLVERLGPERRPDEPIESRHADVAASAQALLEEVLLHVARALRARTGERRLCLAGGVALNCVANSRLAEEAGFDEVFVQPAAGDNGTSLGAALYVAHQVEGLPRREVMESDALGPSFTDAEVARTLDEAGLDYEACPDVAAAVARLLADGEVVGWFQGRAEFGPRALGQRSILADPRSRAVKARLDGTIKRREPFRPYAPSVLREAHHDFFAGPGDSPFMIRSFAVRPEKRDLVPAIVHVDGSARVQTVEARVKPLFHRLISEFARLTGVPVVLNTSFNAKGEPMVCSVDDALRCYHATGLDALAVGSFLLRKRRGGAGAAPGAR